MQSSWPASTVPNLIIRAFSQKRGVIYTATKNFDDDDDALHCIAWLTLHLCVCVCVAINRQISVARVQELHVLAQDAKQISNLFVVRKKRTTVRPGLQFPRIGERHGF